MVAKPVRGYNFKAMQKSQPRKPSLGINFDLGDFGAVVVYSGHEEYPVALLPDAAPVNDKQAYELAALYKKRGSKVLTVTQTGRVLGIKKKKPAPKKAASAYNLPYAE